MRRLSLLPRWAGHFPGTESTGPGDRVYLTFDDGPHPEWTPDLLRVLHARGVLGTFFFLGRRTELDPGLVRETVAAGHAVGSHGYGHLDAWTSTGRAAVEDLSRGTAIIEQVVSNRVARVRPPYGHIRWSTLRWARLTGRTTTLWSLMPGDFARGVRPEEIARRIARAICPGDIVALHEGLEGSARTTALAIDLVRAEHPHLEFAALA